MRKWCLLLALLALNRVYAAESKFSREAMQLATLHFNRDGKRLIEFGSPEHELMRAALVKVHAEQGLSPEPAPFAILEFHSTLLKMGARDEVYDKQVQAFITLVAGCAPTKAGKGSRYTLDNACTSQSAQALVGMGFATFEGEFRKATPEMGADSLVLELTHRRKADLRYFTSRLEVLKDVKALFGENLKKADARGKNATTGLLDSDGKAALTAPFRLQYQKGKEYILMRMTPVKKGTGYDVNISDVSKSEHRFNTVGEDRG